MASSTSYSYSAKRYSYSYSITARAALSNSLGGEYEYEYETANVQHSVDAESRHSCRKRLPASFYAGFRCIIVVWANVFRSDQGAAAAMLPVAQLL
ncbi:hypothetical protein [Novipirellula maiorica]|uniref:hypothetical protein n=1 Tax=Novipirellula maiorica TaxID=1265734 RepID=UPI0011819B8C|nr:hypothetical protein [Rhodopirellula maiorica]